MEIWKKMWVGVFFLNTVYTLVNSETDCRCKRTETFAQPSCTLRCHVLQWSADLLMKLMLIRAVARVMLRNAQASQWWGVYVPLPGEKKEKKCKKWKQTSILWRKWRDLIHVFHADFMVTSLCYTCTFVFIKLTKRFLYLTGTFIYAPSPPCVGSGYAPDANDVQNEELNSPN